mmetsp:Transcript_30551/g.70454  ORF Transcript_30551/g.70454 Transcript_30551/m.70454 type:complete len:201 (-) Transcript_30551:763-1365(-)
MQEGEHGQARADHEQCEQDQERRGHPAEANLVRARLAFAERRGQVLVLCSAVGAVKAVLRHQVTERRSSVSPGRERHWVGGQHSTHLPQVAASFRLHADPLREDVSEGDDGSALAFGVGSDDVPVLRKHMQVGVGRNVADRPGLQLANTQPTALFGGLSQRAELCRPSIGRQKRSKIGSVRSSGDQNEEGHCQHNQSSGH